MSELVRITDLQQINALYQTNIKADELWRYCVIKVPIKKGG
jgi:hypothetical protein